MVDEDFLNDLGCFGMFMAGILFMILIYYILYESIPFL